MNNKRKILILEDDLTLSAGIVSAFSKNEFDFTECHSIKEAKQALDENSYDVLLLDVNLPDGNGVELCKEIRQSSNIPIMLMTVKDLETDIVYGLDAGADEYVTKPFTLMVLRAKVNALLRRAGSSESTGAAGEFLYNESPFSFDFLHMKFEKNNEQIELSKTEQKLLRILTLNKNQIMSKEILIDRIWTDGSDYVDENALSVTIKRLRDKLEEDPSNPKYIKNIYGQGYKWEM